MIESTQFYRLDMRISGSMLDVVVFSKREDNSMIYESFELSCDENGSILKSLEETVYDNSLLLREFEQTNIVIETEHFAIVPDFVVENSNVLEKIFAETNGDIPENTEIIIDRIKSIDCAIALAVDRNILGFLYRAFNNPSVYHNLSPLIRYFSDRRRHGNTTGMFINLRGTSFDAVVFKNNTLRLANTIKFRDVSDAVYYILALRKTLEIDDDSEEILVSGERATRIKVINSLREFIPYVMPVIFPSAIFRAGRTSLNAPFDLIVLSLCE